MKSFKAYINEEVEDLDELYGKKDLTAIKKKNSSDFNKSVTKAKRAMTKHGKDSPEHKVELSGVIKGINRSSRIRALRKKGVRANMKSRNKEK